MLLYEFLFKLFKYGFLHVQRKNTIKHQFAKKILGYNFIIHNYTCLT